MTKEQITLEQFEVMLQREIDAHPDCVGIGSVKVTLTEADNGGLTWMPMFYGLTPKDKAGGAAASEIMQRLDAEYELAQPHR